MAFGNALAFPFHRSKLAAAVAWTPANLFLDGEAGGWYDPTYQAEGDSYPLWQTVAAEDEADAVGDPIGLYLSNPRANEEDFSQATSAERPTLGQVPQGVGIVNRLNAPSEDLTSAAWTKSGNIASVSATDVVGGITLNRIQEGSSAGATRGVSRTITIPAGATINISFYVYTSSPSRFIRAQATSDSGANGFRALFNPNTGAASASPVSAGTGTVGTTTTEDLGDGLYRVSIYGTVSPAATSVSINWFLQDQGSTYAASYNGDGSSYVSIGGIQWSVGSAIQPYQKTNGSYEITQTGVPSILLPYYDGGDYLSLGNPALSGGCSFFADASQEWAVGGVFNSVTAGILTIFAKASATSASKTLEVYRNAAGALRLVVRGTDTSSGIPLAFGLFHSWLLVWDGSVLQLYIDNHAPVTISVGTAVEEATEVPLIGARTASSPAGHFNGFNDLLLMRSGEMTAEQIEHWREYVNNKYGVA